MGYEDAPATKMLATHCVFCGKELVDAVSVDNGYGPCCEKKYALADPRRNSADQKAANKAIYEAAIAAQSGQIEKVNEAAELIASLGFIEAAERMQRRFKNAARLARIEIREVRGQLFVRTPYRRGEAKEFLDAWRSIYNRRWHAATKENSVPAMMRREVFELLKRFFPGAYGKGPKGLFRIPGEQKKAK